MHSIRRARARPVAVFFKISIFDQSNKSTRNLSNAPKNIFSYTWSSNLSLLRGGKVN